MISIQQAAEKLVLVSGHRFSDAESLRNQMPLQVLRIENPVRPQRLKAPSKLALPARLKACPDTNRPEGESVPCYDAYLRPCLMFSRDRGRLIQCL